MTVNVQLQVSGDNISTYDIYQNTDDFAVALATGVTPTELQSDYELTADDSASVIRFVPDAACGNYKDIFINFNDTTPSITLQNDAFWDTNSRITSSSLVTANNGIIFGNLYNDVLYTFGAGFTTVNDSNIDDPAGRVFCINDTEFRYIGQDGTYLKYTADNQWWDFEQSPTVPTHNITGSILDFTKHNGLYYARTENSIYRSENASTFISVLDYDTVGLNATNKSIQGYGNTLYATNFSKLYKSIDNGLNWTELDTGVFTGSKTTLYVESELNFMFLNNRTQWVYSQDGGESFSVSWIQPFRQASYIECSDIIKIGDVYYYSNSNGFLSYTSDPVFSETPGTFNNIPNTETIAKDTALKIAVYACISLIASEDKVVYLRPYWNPSGDDRQKMAFYVGEITNT